MFIKIWWKIEVWYIVLGRENLLGCFCASESWSSEWMAHRNEMNLSALPL